MKRKIIFSLLLSSVLTSGYSMGIAGAEATTPIIEEVPSQKMSKEKFEEIRKKSNKQNKLEKDLAVELEQDNLYMEDIQSEGDYYFNGDDQLVILLKDEEQAKNKTKAKKLKEKVEKVDKSNVTKAASLNVNDIDPYIVQPANYSHDELFNILETFYEDNSSISFSKNTSIRLSAKDNNLQLITDSISDTAISDLEKKYGNAVNITVDPAFKVASEYAAAKSRLTNWNSLGAGIGITRQTTSTRYSQCTTAGIAYKDSRYFIVTAGHCLGLMGGTMKQFNAYYVGHSHLDARESDYDLGLILLDSLPDEYEIPGGRYVSNGLYLMGTEASVGGYDAHFNGSESPVEGRRVCKTGITTGYTCGKVINTSSREWFSQVHTIVDVLPGEGTYSGNYLLAQGDSGGALINPGNYNLVGITSQLQEIGAIYADASAGRRGYFTPFVQSAQKYGIYLYTNSTRKAISQ